MSELNLYYLVGPLRDGGGGEPDGWRDKTITRLRHRLTDAEKLLQEWLRTPFFETKEEWQTWVNEFGPKVRAFLSGR